MGKPRRIGDAMLLTAVTTLNGVGVVGNGLSGRFVNHLQPVSKMHRHRQQPTKRRPSTTLTNK